MKAKGLQRNQQLRERQIYMSKITKEEREKSSRVRQKVSENLSNLAQTVRDAEYGLVIGKNTTEQVEFAKGMLKEERDAMAKLSRGVAKQRAWVRGREF
jgi:hypothetical protein